MSIPLYSDKMILTLFYPSSRNISHKNLATYVVTVSLSTLGFASLFWHYMNQKVVLVLTGLNIPVIM